MKSFQTLKIPTPKKRLYSNSVNAIVQSLQNLPSPSLPEHTLQQSSRLRLLLPNSTFTFQKSHPTSTSKLKSAQQPSTQSTLPEMNSQHPPPKRHITSLSSTTIYFQPPSLRPSYQLPRNRLLYRNRNVSPFNVTPTVRHNQNAPGALKFVWLRTK